VQAAVMAAVLVSVCTPCRNDFCSAHIGGGLGAAPIQTVICFACICDRNACGNCLSSRACLYCVELCCVELLS
jgi:hypothetical protein